MVGPQCVTKLESLSCDALETNREISRKEDTGVASATQAHAVASATQAQADGFVAAHWLVRRSSHIKAQVTSVNRNTSVDWFASLSMGELLRSLWHYRLSIIGSTIVLTAVLAAVVFILPVRYDSDAQLLVRLGRGTLSTDPTSSITPTVSVQETRLSQVNSVKEMLQSRALAEQVVMRVGADRILEPHGVVERTLQYWTEQLSARLGRGGGGGGGEGQLSSEETKEHLKVEEAIAKLQDNLHLTTTKNAYTLHLRVRSGSPYLSRDLLDALVDLYQDYHVQAYHADGTLTFFEDQTNRSYQAAIQTREKVRQAKNAMGVIEIEAARVALREQLSQAERELAQTETDLAGTSSEVKRYESELASLPERVQSETITGITSIIGDGMRQKLYDLEVQAKELASKLQEDHPQMRAIRDQLAAAAKIAQGERKEQPQNREAINPVYQQLELAYRTSLIHEEGLRAKRESLLKQLEELDQDIIELNKNELELTKLTWEATLAENLYLQNAQNRDKAKLLDDLDVEGLSEISVVQPASLQLKKSSPKRFLLLVAAAMLAGGLAVLQAIMRTVMYHSSGSGRRMAGARDIDEIDLSQPRPAEQESAVAMAGANN